MLAIMTTLLLQKNQKNLAQPNRAAYLCSIVWLHTKINSFSGILIYKEVARDWLRDPLATIHIIEKGANSCPDQYRLGAYKLTDNEYPLN